MSRSALGPLLTRFFFFSWNSKAGAGRSRTGGGHATRKLLSGDLPTKRRSLADLGLLCDNTRHTPERLRTTLGRPSISVRLALTQRLGVKSPLQRAAAVVPAWSCAYHAGTRPARAWRGCEKAETALLGVASEAPPQNSVPVEWGAEHKTKWRACWSMVGEMGTLQTGAARRRSARLLSRGN